jgi:hypothetical protein
MFDLAPTTSAPIKRTKSSAQFQLGKDRFLPPPLQGQHHDYLVELTGEEDQANAKAWPVRRKMRAAFVLGWTTLVASWGNTTCPMPSHTHGLTKGQAPRFFQLLSSPCPSSSASARLLLFLALLYTSVDSRLARSFGAQYPSYMVGYSLRP